MFDKIEKLCSERGISLAKLSREIGVSSTSIYKWKLGAQPRAKQIKSMADYFGVPVAYFADSDNKQMRAVFPPIEENAVQVDDFILYNVPVYEDIAAGFGAQAEDRIVDYQPMPFRTITEAEEMVMFHVVGDSMMPKIENGDYILVKKQTSVDSGDIAAVLLDEELGLIKKVEYGSDYVSLISLNPAYPPRVFAGKDVTRLRILGKVKKIISEP